jgi:hypothetical protein
MGVRSQGAFPALALPGPDDGPRPLSDAWRDGEALFLIGHRNCKTTRQTLPFLDRIHRRRAAGRSVVAILQDDPATARELRASLDLALDVRLEADPYPVASALELVAVPTLFLVGRGGEIEGVCEAFVRAELEAFAERLGAPPPLFAPEDDAPALRPG